MSMFDEMKDKASEAAGEHGDQVEEYSDKGLDQAQTMADDQLGEEHADEVAKGRDMLDDRIGDGSDDASGEDGGTA
jgi:hypothetical protein